MKEIDKVRKEIKKIYKASKNEEVKRRCALALVALNFEIECDITTEEEEDTPF